METSSYQAPLDIVSYVGLNTPAGHESSLPMLVSALQNSIKMISAKVARAGLEGLFGMAQQQGGGGGDKQKKLDVVANEILKSVLGSCREVAVLASEEEDNALEVNPGGRYVVVFDPLDGSRNIDAAIPTGTIFGIYERHQGADIQADALQPGTQLIAAGYSLYSSAVMMVISTGKGTHGFTLDPQCREFILTHPSIHIPKRGQIYSVNDARYHDWPAGLQQYIDTIRQGKGQNPKQYSARYICSLVGDFHRTLLYGGVAMNPREHLRLVYEGNPLAMLAEEAGGLGSDGKRRVREIVPSRLHQRLPLFLGSEEDIRELESYGDVQQLSGKTYEV